MAAGDQFDDVYNAALSTAAAALSTAGAEQDPSQAPRRQGQGVPRRLPWLEDDTRTVDERDDWQKERQASMARLGTWMPTLRGFYDQLTGDEAGARENYAQADAAERRAQELDSGVDPNPMNWRSVGDVAAGTRKLLTSSAPDSAMALAGGGLARGLARRTVLNAERRAIADTMSRELGAASGVSSLSLIHI